MLSFLLLVVVITVHCDLETQIVVTKSIQPQQITLKEQRHIQLEDYYRGFDLYYNLTEETYTTHSSVTLNNKLTLLDSQSESHFVFQSYLSKSFQMGLFGDWNRQAVFLMAGNRLLFYSIDQE